MDKEKYKHVESVYCYTCRKENKGYIDKSGENFIQDYDDWILIDRIEIWGMGDRIYPTDPRFELWFCSKECADIFLNKINKMISKWSKEYVKGDDIPKIRYKSLEYQRLFWVLYEHGPLTPKALEERYGFTKRVHRRLNNFIDDGIVKKIPSAGKEVYYDLIPDFRNEEFSQFAHSFQKYYTVT